MRKHPYHIVDPRPWPLSSSLGAQILLRGLAGWMSQFDIKGNLVNCGILLLLLSVVQWWRDVNREATLQGKHTSQVENRIRLGVLLFIVSEIFFFASFFWSFFHASLRPSVESGSFWPPAEVIPINPFEVPLLNTTVLLSRGATITWAHMSLLSSNGLESHIGFLCTVLLGVLFSLLQLMEYKNSSFTIADSVYGRTFYLATGFHGVHVLIGTIFITVMWWRHSVGHFSRARHFGFEASAWYWHFVDVVWLFLFITIYWWGF